MPLSRFCAAAVGAIILSFAGNSFATAEDAPLPGDFQPPRQGKTTSKPAPINNGSNKANDVPARNIPPVTTSKPQEKTAAPAEPSRQPQAETRRSPRGDSQPVTRKAARQTKPVATTQRATKARNKLRDGKQVVRSNKALRTGKKNTRQLRAEAQRSRTGKAIGSRKASTSKRSLTTRKRQSSLQQAAKPAVKAKRSRTASNKPSDKQNLAPRKARASALNQAGKHGNTGKASQRKTRKATLNTAGKRAVVSKVNKAKPHKRNSKVRRPQQQKR